MLFACLPQVHVLSDKLMFFVEDQQAAIALKQLRSIEARGSTLSVFVKPCPPPQGGQERGGERQRFSRGGGGRGSGGRGGGSGRGGQMGGDATMQEDPTMVIQLVLGQRFDPNTRSLDLSDMFHDESKLLCWLISSEQGRTHPLPLSLSLLSFL